MDRPIAYLLELRLRTRGNPEGRAIVDRCLALVARANAAADAETLQAIEADVRVLEDDLALRFGAPRTKVLQ